MEPIREAALNLGLAELANTSQPAPDPAAAPDVPPADVPPAPVQPSDLQPGGPMQQTGDDGQPPNVLQDITRGDYRWYLPVFEVVAPTPASTPPDPYGFTYTATGHDANQQPVIEATITVTVRTALTDDQRADIPDPDQCGPVQLTSLQALLVIPYADADSGGPSSVTLAAAPADPVDDTYTLVFTVGGDQAKAAYGSLALPQYQPTRTQLQLTLNHLEYSRPDTPPGSVNEGVLPPTDTTGWVFTPPVEGGEPGLEGWWAPVETSKEQDLDVFVPCADFGTLYVDATDPDHPVAVGCRDAMALGQLPKALYDLVTDLTTPDYAVYDALGRPGLYVVLPRRYRVGRSVPGQPGVVDWSPLVQWVQVFDATRDTALPCKLQAELHPDLTQAQVIALTAALSARTAHPTVLLPTGFGTGTTGFAAQSWNVSQSARTVVKGDSIMVDIEVDYADAVVLNGMLGAGASEGMLVGNGAFPLSDGSSLGPVELHIDVSRLTGPWPGGPVLATPADGTNVTVTNHAENDATVTRLYAVLPDGSVQTPAQGLALVVRSGASADVAAVTPSGATLVPDHTLAGSTAAVVAQQRVYLEDLHTTVSIVTGTALATGGITGVDVTARLDGDPQSFTFTIGPGVPLYQFDLVQPLVADRQASTGLLHLGATVHRSGQPDTTTGDCPVDLHHGVLIQLSDVLAAR
ncbi:hypothetical protein ACIBCA_22735 [Kitasatospora sp. NPDC051170]|uniref:hypothetical protein n=1 Tax=Kitasatospora sp. NPDC051170 TaxID=3364056 RepID=UPI00379D31A0